ncbi:MAG: hypothetical protein WD072_04355, partial [Pirellulales bacterium]
GDSPRGGDSPQGKIGRGESLAIDSAPQSPTGNRGKFTPVPDFPSRIFPVWKYHETVVNQPSEQSSFPRLRPSVSHSASLQAEIVRVRRMTVEERVKAALGLARRFASLQPAPRKT